MQVLTRARWLLLGRPALAAWSAYLVLDGRTRGCKSRQRDRLRSEGRLARMNATTSKQPIPPPQPIWEALGRTSVTAVTLSV